jgi:hypothetical protein
MATPAMTAATMGCKTMEPAETAPVPTTSAAVPTAAPTTPTVPTAFCDCRRDVRDDAKRAHGNARCQDTYCFLLHGAFPNHFLLHGAFPNQMSKSRLQLERSRADLTDLTVFAAASFPMTKPKFH